MIYTTEPENFSPRFEIVSCFLESGGKILLLHRHENKSEGGKWGVPAGKIDPGEDKTQAMVREMQEETGLEIPADNFNFLRTVYVRYPEHDFVYHMFKSNLDEGRDIQINSYEHQNFQWLTPHEALALPLIRDMDACIKIDY